MATRWHPGTGEATYGHAPREGEHGRERKLALLMVRQGVSKTWENRSLVIYHYAV